jgi:hypothetical protein
MPLREEVAETMDRLAEQMVVAADYPSQVEAEAVAALPAPPVTPARSLRVETAGLAAAAEPEEVCSPRRILLSERLAEQEASAAPEEEGVVDWPLALPYPPVPAVQAVLAAEAAAVQDTKAVHRPAAEVVGRERLAAVVDSGRVPAPQEALVQRTPLRTAAAAEPAAAVREWAARYSSRAAEISQSLELSTSAATASLAGRVAPAESPSEPLCPATAAMAATD